MSAIAWTTIDNALIAWVMVASGLDANHVIFADRGGPRPSAPYIEISIPSIGGAGCQDWRVYDNAPNPVAGAELRVRARGMRMATIALQCFAVDGGGDAATRMLSDVISALPLNEYALDLAGLGIGDIRPVQLVQGRRGSILEPRAVAELDVHLASELESRETYIERIQIAIHETTTNTNVTKWIPTPP